jgi:DNA repair ATPase RecN
MKKVEKIWAELSAKAQEASKEVELSEEQKVELALTDRVVAMADKLRASENVMNKRLDSIFVPIREIEKAVSSLQSPSDLQDSFKTFMSNLDDLERAHQEALQNIKDVENDLGVSIPMPSELNNVVKLLQRFQDAEQQMRKEINEYSQAYKKFK